MSPARADRRGELGIAAATGVPVAAHFMIVSALALVSSLWLVNERGESRRLSFMRPSQRLLLLGLLAFCAFTLDGAGYNWSAVDVRVEHGATPGMAAATFTAFALALSARRLFGDRLLARGGRVRVVQASAAIAAAGGALVVWAPSSRPALAGWALFGVGLAAVDPTLLGAAPRAGDAPAAAAIAVVSRIGYLGSFTGPPLIGAIAQATSLSTALIVLIAVSALLGGLAKPLLTNARTPSTAMCARRF